MTADAPYARPYRLSDLAARKPTRFTLEPDDAARAAIAAYLDLEGLRKLTFKGEIRPAGRHDWVLEGELTGTVVQACVVTLAPVTTAIRETVARRYLADMPEPEGDEAEIPADDTLEPLGDAIDPGAVMLEELALALPAYPRAPGVAPADIIAAPPGAEPLTDETRKPFAGLAELLKKPGPKD